MFILAPFFTSKILHEVNQALFYSVSFDGSNKGNIKIFPFIINNFTIECGIKRSVLEVVEQPRETADNIVDTLRTVLKKHNLDPVHLTSLGADNTNANFGRHHSVFSIMQLQVSNLFKGAILIKNKSVKFFEEEIIFFA